MTKISSKFAQVQTDPDTRIKAQRQVSIGGIDALYQRWVWDGVIGESLIFCAEDIPGLSDRGIEELVGKAGIDLASGKYDAVVRRTEKCFVFVNYGFET